MAPTGNRQRLPSPWLRRAAASGRQSRGYRPGAGQLTGRLTRRPARPSVQRVAGGGEEPVGEGEVEWLVFSVLQRNFHTLPRTDAKQGLAFV